MFSKGILPFILAIWLFQLATCAPSYDSWIRSVHNDDDSFIRVKRQGQDQAVAGGGAPGKPVMDNSKITAPVKAVDGQDKSSPAVSLPVAKKDASSTPEAKESKTGDVAPAPGSSSSSPTTAPPTPKVTVTESKPKEEKIIQVQAQGSSSDEGRSQMEPDEIKEAMLIIDGRGDPNYPTDDDSMDGTEFMTQRCSRVRCTSPPTGFECKAKPIEVTEPIPQLIGLTSECCPVHVCRRQDGSTFLHYAIEVDDDAGSGNQSPQVAPQATFSASYSLLSNGNNNGNRMPFPGPHSSNLPFQSPMFPPIFPFFPPASSFSISSNKQASSSAGRNGPPPSFNGILFPSKPDQESERFSFPNSASSVQIVLPPSQQSGNKYPSPSAGSQRDSQNVLSNSPMLSLDRIVRNVAFGAPAQMPQFDSQGPYQPQPAEGQRERRNVFVGNWQGLPAGGMPIRPAASPFGGFPMFPF